MQNRQFTIQDYLDILLRRWQLIVILFVIIPTIIIPIGLKLPKKYLSSTLIMVEKQQVPSEYIKTTVAVDIAERMQTISQQIMSRSLLEKVIATLNIYASSKEPMDLKVERLSKNINIQVKGKNAFTISFKGDDPEMVMKVVNTLTSLFIDENLKIREQQAAGTSEFLEGELKSIKDKLESREKALKEYKTQHIGELPEQQQANLASLNRFQLELQSITDALRSAEDRLVIIQRQSEDRKKELESKIDVNPLQKKLDALRTSLADLQTRYTDKYPDITRMKNEIKETEEKLKKEMESTKEEIMGDPDLRRDPLYQNLLNQIKNVEFEISTLRERQKSILEQTKLYHQRVENTPAREQQLLTLNRDYENLQKNYNSLLNRKLEAQLSENLEKRQKGERFRIVDPANLPQVPYWPDKKIILLAAIGLGLGTGFGLALLLEFIIPGFKKPHDVEDVIGLPVFATIPNFFSNAPKKGLNKIWFLINKRNK